MQRRTPQEMAQERVELQATLQGIAMWNTFGQSIEELSKVALHQIETQKRLAEVEREIKDYIEGKY